MKQKSKYYRNNIKNNNNNKNKIDMVNELINTIETLQRKNKFLENLLVSVDKQYSEIKSRLTQEATEAKSLLLREIENKKGLEHVIEMLRAQNEKLNEKLLQKNDIIGSLNTFKSVKQNDPIYRVDSSNVIDYKEYFDLFENLSKNRTLESLSKIINGNNDNAETTEKSQPKESEDKNKSVSEFYNKIIDGCVAGGIPRRFFNKIEHAKNIVREKAPKFAEDFSNIITEYKEKADEIFQKYKDIQTPVREEGNSKEKVKIFDLTEDDIIEMFNKVSQKYKNSEVKETPKNEVKQEKTLQEKLSNLTPKQAEFICKLAYPEINWKFHVDNTDLFSLIIHASDRSIYGVINYGSDINNLKDSIKIFKNFKDVEILNANIEAIDRYISSLYI